MTSSSEFSTRPLALVRPADLYEIFSQVAGIYAFSTCAYLGRPNECPHPGLDLEFKVSVHGAIKGLIVLRTTLGGGRILADDLRGQDRPGDFEAADAFRETCNLFTGHLLTSCLGGQRRAFDPFMPERSKPNEWPGRTPDAACALLLETEPVELRYWQDDQEQAA
jgi:hypothetical protein